MVCFRWKIFCEYFGNLGIIKKKLEKIPRRFRINCGKKLEKKLREIGTDFKGTPRKLRFSLILKKLTRNLVDSKKKTIAKKFRESFVETLGLFMGNIFSNYFRKITRNDLKSLKKLFKFTEKHLNLVTI